MQSTVVCWPNLDRRVSYTPSWGREGCCRLRVWHEQEIAVVTELDDNPGPSVTNAIETIADVVQQILDRPIGTDDGYLLVEHYEAGGRSWRDPTFDVVRFLVTEPWHSSPIWKPMGSALPELRAALQHPSMLSRRR